MPTRLALPLAAALLAATLPSPAVSADASPAGAVLLRRWGDTGHRLVGEAAARAVPAAMPEFFRQAVGQLAYLNPEPDRWRQPRDGALDPAMDAAYAPDHYVDLELLPPNALLAPDRFAYADTLRAAKVSVATAGVATYRVLELTARLREEFRLWRREQDPRTRLWIEQRILNDAGVLGHYVADLANPHHTSVHHHGWTGANPKGYSTDRTIHSRFESQFVETHLTLADFEPLVERRERTLLPLRDSLTAYVRRTHDQLGRLYDLERQEPFGRETRSPAHERFVAERMAAGATMLRDVWWTAWVTSADSAAAGPR